MWFKDDYIQIRRTGGNRSKRRHSPHPTLLVNARVEAQRKEKMQRLGAIFLSVIALAGILWVVMIGARVTGNKLFAQNDFYTIKHIETELVSGGKLKPWQVEYFGKVERGMNLFAIDIDDVRKNLEDVSQVSHVEVKRRLPDTLTIAVSERMAIANVGNHPKQDHLAVDREGFLLGPSSRSETLPTIMGVKDPDIWPGKQIADSHFQDALYVLDICDSTRLGDYIVVDRIDISTPEYLNIYLRNGERIIMARERIDARMKRLAAALRVAEDQGRRIASIDMTIDDNVPIQYR